MISSKTEMNPVTTTLKNPQREIAKTGDQNHDPNDKLQNQSTLKILLKITYIYYFILTFP